MAPTMLRAQRCPSGISSSGAHRHSYHSNRSVCIASATTRPCVDLAEQCNHVDAWPSASALRSALPALAASMLMVFLPLPAHASEVIQGPARVVDGDTLVINEKRIRLYGIDAPEKAQSCKSAQGAEYSCGQKSKDALTAEIGSKIVTCVTKNQDQYGRYVSTCEIGGGALGPTKELNSWLVKNGLAVAYRQYGKEYIPLEEQAKLEKQGVWEGPFTPPNEWRKQQKAAGGAAGGVPGTVQPVSDILQAARAASGGAAGAQAPAPTCPGGAAAIKGNISAKGVKIYFAPGTRNYDQVKIDLEDGERYFCSAAEAEAAGWRAPLK